MAARIVPIALIPAPPAPTTWMLRMPRRSTIAMLFQQVGHAGGGVGMPHGTSSPSHSPQRVGVTDQRVEGGGQRRGGEVPVEDDDASAGGLELAGLHRLMVVRGDGKGHEDR